MYTAIQSAIAVDFTLYKIKLLLLLLSTYVMERIECLVQQLRFRRSNFLNEPLLQLVNIGI